MRYARNPTVLWRSTSGGPVLLAPDTEVAERLGGVAAAVWEVLDVPITLREVAGAVQQLIDTTEDVDAALDALVGRALLVRSA